MPDNCNVGAALTPCEAFSQGGLRIMVINYDDNEISYSGRIDFDGDGAHLYYPATSAAVSFKGSFLSVSIENKTYWGTLSLGYVIDGRQGRVPLQRFNDEKTAEYRLTESLDPNQTHTLILYKMHAANHYFSVKSFETDGEFVAPPEKPDLKLEFYGDSVSAGEVSEAVDFVGRCDPSSHDSIYDNAWFSYTWQTARLLNAQIHDIAQGGIAVFDGTGYFNMPDTVGMESVYDKVRYFGGSTTPWNFSRYIPDAVIFALGQNDNHNCIEGEPDMDIYDPVYRKKWKDGYKGIVKNVAKHYPADTKYIFLTTLLRHDPEWDRAIDEAVNELKSENISAYHFLFKRNGDATDGHPRIPEHREMAEELSEFIKGIIS